MQLVKAEILWSRVCKLSCPYCAMVTGTKPEKDIELWKKGAQQLAQLDCGFAAIYGAEPLDDFNGLPEFVFDLTENRIESTLITNCCTPGLHGKLGILHRAGLRSLTVSYDGDEILDKSSAAKTQRGLETLRWFRDSFVDLRDVAVVITINSKNYKQVPGIIEKMSAEGIWTLFDFIHPDRGQNGSKCKNTELTNELLFKPEDLDGVIEMLKEVGKLKEAGKLIHWSQELLDFIVSQPNVLIQYNWHCAYSKDFPSWITVDNTGEVSCCDDFKLLEINSPSWDSNLELKEFHIWDIADRFEEFKTYWQGRTIVECPGCIWNTHWTANAIKRGNLPFSDYIHRSIL
jgi:MoaA/NifB/PqqE/SkfB family radical SAM enzyme